MKYTNFLYDSSIGTLDVARSGITEIFRGKIHAIQAELLPRRTHNRCNFTVFRFQWKKSILKC